MFSGMNLTYSEILFVSSHKMYFSEKQVLDRPTRIYELMDFDKTLSSFLSVSFDDNRPTTVSISEPNSTVLRFSRKVSLPYSPWVYKNGIQHGNLY